MRKSNPCTNSSNDGPSATVAAPLFVRQGIMQRTGQITSGIAASRCNFHRVFGIKINFKKIWRIKNFAENLHNNLIGHGTKI